MRPASILCCFFCLGVLCACAGAAFLCLGALLAAVLYMAGRFAPSGLVLVFLSFTAGYGDFIWQDGLLRRDPLALTGDGPVLAEGVVRGPVRRSGSAVTVPLEIELVSRGGSEHRVKATVLARISPVPEDPFLWGERLRIRGRLERPPPRRIPGGFDYREHLARQGIHRILLSARRAPPERLGFAASNPFLERAWRLRERFQYFARRAFPEPHSSFFLGIVLGDCSSLPGEVVQSFRDTGTLHILAASGMNVGILAAFIMLVAGRLGITRARSALMSMPLIILYTFMAGASPSVVRAAVMCILALAAVALRRESHIFHFITLAALGMLIARPYNLLDVSFQLSFLAVLGLIFLSNPIAERLARLPRWLAVPLAVSVSCHIALWPLMAWYFQQCSLITTAANLVIVPAAELLLPLGLIQCTLSLVCETLGAPFAAADLALIHFLLKSAAFFQGVPHAFFPLSQPSLPCMVLYYTALFLPHTFVAAMPSFPLRKVPLFLWGAFLIAFAANVIPSAPGHLRAVFFDVGEAEAAFFRLPGGGTLMVDGGGRQGAPDGVRSDLVQYLVRERVGRIDLLVLSHPHLDHVGGMPAIVSAMSTGTFVDGGMEVSQSACLKTMAALKKRGVPVFVPRRGDLWSFPGGEVRVLRSHADYPSGSIQEPNDASIVLKIIYETVSFLMMGDLEKEQERALVESGEDLSCTVLKCAHQGSATSTTEELLEAARPRYAVISVGRNAFGHPSPRVLERLERRGVTCLRTDERGTVQFDVRNGAIAVSVLR